jgi:hypothetical protein
MPRAERDDGHADNGDGRPDQIPSGGSVAVDEPQPKDRHREPLFFNHRYGK